MPGYDRAKAFNVQLNGTYSDNDEVGFFPIPADRECAIYDIRGYVQTAEASDEIEITNKAGTVLGEVALSSTGNVAENTGASFPIKIAASSTGDCIIVKLKGAIGTDVNAGIVVEFDY